MKADRPMGVPKPNQARVHSIDRGELRLLTSEPPKSHPTTSRGEALLKEVLDFIFQDEPHLDNHRPAWLGGLELDRYYPRLKIAFEYQGFQHSYFVPHYHNTIQDYKDQKKRDRKKRQLCRERKAVLVNIYYWHLSIGQVCQWTIKALKKLKRWRQTSEITEIVRARSPKAVGQRTKKAINQKCSAYKKLVKANYDSKKWVKHHKSYAVKHYPRGRIPTRRKPKGGPVVKQARKKQRDWSRQIAQAEKELLEAHADLR